MIEAAERAKHRLAEWLKPSPTVRSKKSDNLWFKCEQFQSTGSFKIRGALNKIASPRETGDSVGEVITASSGNHGIACAQAGLVIPPFSMGLSRRIHAAVFSSIAGVMPPIPMLGLSFL
jgi:threonine dehydratase